MGTDPDVIDMHRAAATSGHPFRRGSLRHGKLMIVKRMPCDV